MKKTLVLTHEYYPFHGGVANYCYGLFSHLPEQNYLVSTDMKKQEIDSKKTFPSALPIYRFTNLLTPYIRPRWLLGLWNVSRLVKREKIEIIFTPNIFPLGQICYLLYKWLHIPYIISLHGLDIRLALKKNKKLAIKILASAQHVIVNSQATANNIHQLVGPEKISVITPYLHTSLNTTHVEKDPTDTTISLISVGRLTKRKGHDMVIQAINLLNNPNLHYTIIGSGAEEQNLRNLIREWKLTNHVTIKTKISDEELQELYQNADIFIQTTRNIGDDVEGYGIVYLEAASYRLPIIASLNTSVEEIFDQSSALLIDGTKPESIANAITQLINEPETRLRLGQAAQNRLQQLPTRTDKAQQLAKLLS